MSPSAWMWKQQQQQQRFSTLLFDSSPSSCTFSFKNAESPTNRKSTNSSSKKKLYPFEEARRLARGHGFSSVEEFLAYDCPGVYQVPKNSPELYPTEWTCWDDFLGLALDFKTACIHVSSLGWKSKEEYMNHVTTDARGKKAGIEDESHWVYRLPYRPDLYYQESWKSWDQFLLGTV